MKEKLYYTTGFRLNKDERAAYEARGLHVYNLRERGREFTIEPTVGVDFLATIITNFPVEFPKAGPFAGIVFDGHRYLKSIGAREVCRCDDVRI